tara:strand:+ start:2617 stop:2889 length:273 start_codon:yes stop_codon:yes gene_type:complete
MTYYKSPNDYTAYSFTELFYWEATNFTYNESLDTTFVTIDLGYSGDVVTETRSIDGEYNTSTIIQAVIDNLPEYALSTGPIHGGGFPVKL